MSHVPSTLTVEHDAYTTFVGPGVALDDAACFGLVADVEPAPNQSLAIPVDDDYRATGVARLYTHLDVWSLPPGSWIVVRRSVTGSVQVRSVRADAPMWGPL